MVMLLQITLQITNPEEDMIGLEQLLVGSLRSHLPEREIKLHLPDQSTIFLGDGNGRPITVRLNGARIVSRLVLYPELAFGEGYMNGDLIIVGDDVHGLLETVVRNVKIQSPVWWMRAINTIRIFQRQFDQNNFVSAAKRNVAQHYDLSGCRIAHQTVLLGIICNYSWVIQRATIQTSCRLRQV